MKLATAVLLARPTAAADRGRVALIAAATTVAGAFLLAAVRIARFSGGDVGAGVSGESGDGLARYVTEPGLRPGVVLAVVLLVVPVLALGVQALRVGSVARDRRMASLRLAGATPRAVRAVAAAEAGGAALVGGLAAGPAYLALWVLLGVLPPAGLALLPAPTPVDAVAWAGVALLAAVGGALAGAAVQGRVVVEALGVRRRTSSNSNRPGRLNLAALVTGLVLLVAGIGGPVAQAGAGDAGIYIMMIGVLLAAFAAGPRLVGLSGRLLSRRAGAEALLAGARLRADPRSSGRVAGVLVICGVALGIDAGLASDFVAERQSTDDGFYLTGFALAALGVLVGASVAVLTLLVGAADGLLDARRPLATLTALGVDQPLLSRVLARQMAAVAVPAIVVGVLIGGGPTLLYGLAEPTHGAVLGRALFTAATAGVAGLAAIAAARLTARLLRSRVRAATDPENLRVA